MRREAAADAAADAAAAAHRRGIGRGRERKRRRHCRRRRRRRRRRQRHRRCGRGGGPRGDRLRPKGRGRAALFRGGPGAGRRRGRDGGRGKRRRRRRERGERGRRRRCRGGRGRCPLASLPASAATPLRFSCIVSTPKTQQGRAKVARRGGGGCSSSSDRGLESVLSFWGRVLMSVFRRGATTTTTTTTGREKKKPSTIEFTCLVVGRDRKLAGEGARSTAAAVSASSLDCLSRGGGAGVVEEGDASSTTWSSSNAIVAKCRVSFFCSPLEKKKGGKHSKKSFKSSFYITLEKHFGHDTSGKRYAGAGELVSSTRRLPPPHSRFPLQNT